MTNKKGFTLIELLVVIAIIGLLSTLAIVSLNSARVKARDAKRVSDIRQIQTAMEMYYTDNGKYNNFGCAATSVVSACAGFRAIATNFAQINDPSHTADVTGTDNCDGTRTSCNYGFDTASDTAYKIFFVTEGTNVQGLTTGTVQHTLTSTTGLK